jgi:phosphate transport system substrate-binding protein
MHKKQDKPENAKEVLAFFDWAYKNGDAAAGQLDYVPLPAGVKTMMRKQWVDQIKSADGKAVFAAK